MDVGAGGGACVVVFVVCAVTRNHGEAHDPFSLTVKSEEVIFALPSVTAGVQLRKMELEGFCDDKSNSRIGSHRRELFKKCDKEADSIHLSAIERLRPGAWEGKGSVLFKGQTTESSTMLQRVDR